MGVQSNAGPAPQSRPEARHEPWLDESLSGGSIVVASSERAARALTFAYHRARRAQGLTAWPAPAIQPWDSFIREAWLQRTPDARMILSALQEQWLWSEIIAADKSAPSLPGPLNRIAKLAMDAHRLLCFYTPRFLSPRSRAAWQQDAAAFSRWLSAFDDACRSGGSVSAARLPFELLPALANDLSARSPLVLAGFDRTLPIQRDVFAAWGSWREAPSGQRADRVAFYRVPDATAELAACALWCAERLSASPHARLLVITQEAAARRGEIERAFSRFLSKASDSAGFSPPFEFSLGIPLSQVALARSALLVLRWTGAPIEEHQLDWLISDGHLAANGEESRVLAAFMRALRHRGLERTHWPLRDFIRQNVQPSLPAAWIARLMHAQQRLHEFNIAHGAARRNGATASPLAWAELVPRLLESAGWPGGRALTSAEFQVLRRWEHAVDACASLGFTGGQVSWDAFLVSLERTLSETLFAPESEDAPILIAGPAESAGLEADGIWFLGASEDAWPAAGARHPLLPFEVQREAETPHASAQLDWRVAEAVTHRLLRSAPEIHFSYSRMAEGVESRPSRLILNAAGAPRDLPAAFLAPPAPDARTLWIEDLSRVPFRGGALGGGAKVLTAQSQCPFKAFAVARLGAESWEPAQAGLTPRQRGDLLHHVLHSIWSGPPGGIRDHADLLAHLDDLEAFVQGHVQTACAQKAPSAARDAMPPAYLALEETRLTTLVVEWLRYEAARVPFTVVDTELKADVEIAGLDLHLRLDRVDRLIDGSLLVIDYKTGNVTPKSWDLPRPDDVQLPQYVCFALHSAEAAAAGLVFARLRVGHPEFAGRVFDANRRLLQSLGSRKALVKDPLTAEALRNWRDFIARMAAEFIEGRAEVDPRDYPKTCERCGLETLCRISEFRMQRDLEGEVEEDEEEAGIA